MAVSEVHKRLFQLYIACNIYTNLIEHCGAKHLREKLLLKLLRGVANDVKYYLAKRTPLRAVIFMARSFPKLLLIKILG